MDKRDEKNDSVKKNDKFLWKKGDVVITPPDKKSITKKEDG